MERLGYLGGLATGGMIILLLTLDDGRGRQVVGGLCQEVTDRLARRGAAVFPDRREWGSPDETLVARDRTWGLVWGHGPHRVRYSVAYDPEELKFALNEMVEDAGAKLSLHAYACEALVDRDRVTGVTFQAKSGRFAVLADVVIDASGDGDVFASAGAGYATEKVLPWLWFTMSGVEDPARAARAGCFRTVGKDKVLLPWGATERVARKIDATDPDDLTYAELACRKQVMAEADRLRAEAPGFAHASIGHIADQLGITESRRLVGQHVLGREEMDRPCADAIAVTGHWTKYESLYHIPYRSLLTREFANLLVAGRCISVDHRVHHATKEIPACMATGQAAGVAAALAVGRGVEPKGVDVEELQRRLEGQGAILRV